MPVLKFLGRGSAFNTKEGNNSAFYIKDKTLYLIDCGCTTFSRLQSTGLLKKVNEIKVIITHMHPDHIGSLGDLVFYSFFMLKKKLDIYYQELDKLEQYLTLVGCSKEMYLLYKPHYFDIHMMTSEITHDRNYKVITSYAYVFMIEDKEIWYSGDSCSFSGLKVDEFDEIYQDTSLADYPDNVHLSLKKLCEAVPSIQDRLNIYCMHIDCDQLVYEATKEGFNVVQIYKGDE